MASLLQSLGAQPVELGFGTSGLRGLVTDMTDLECYLNTRGFLQYLAETDDLRQGETVYLAGDLRDSTPRIMRAVNQAVIDEGMKVVNCGLIPTPAVANFALRHQAPGIMVTGSHIPADRNGIKFYKQAGEVLKADEVGIKAAVAAVRSRLYGAELEETGFDAQAMLMAPEALPAATSDAKDAYLQRYIEVFGADALKGVSLVFYQHSAVGRDVLVELLEGLGATVKPVGRSDVFVPIDSENVTPDDQAYFKQLAAENPDTFAIVSTDGDSDRPFMVDETGAFHRGDVLGAVVATWLQADAAAYPVSSSDAVDSYLSERGVPITHTRIGSPYVIVAMQAAQVDSATRPVGWEVNGGFMTGADMQVRQGELAALPTRDAILPIIVALVAAREAEVSVSQLFDTLPKRFTQAGLIDDFPLEISAQIVEQFSADTPESRAALAAYFQPSDGFSEVASIDSTDGIRIKFTNGLIAHMRPSGNAPQLRIYSVADSQEQADQIVAQAIAEPDGILRTLERGVRG